MFDQVYINRRQKDGFNLEMFIADLIEFTDYQVEESEKFWQIKGDNPRIHLEDVLCHYGYILLGGIGTNPLVIMK